MFQLDVPFVLVESAPRKRGKTHFNKEILPHIEHLFHEIHIFSPSLEFTDDYWAEFHLKPKYHLHHITTGTEFEKVIVDQQHFVRTDTMKRRKDILDGEDKAKQKRMDKRSRVVFEQTRYNSGRKRKQKKKGWNMDYAPNVQVFFEPPDRKYTFLMPEIYAGEPVNFDMKPKREPKKIMDMLVILDDCADQDLFSGVGPATTLAIRGRHFRVSLICSTQLLTKVAFVIRANVDYMMFWKPHTVQETESFIEKFVSKSGVRLFRKLLQKSFTKEHEFILMNPHALQFQDVFAIGETQDFVAGTMRPLFDESQVKALLDS